MMSDELTVDMVVNRLGVTPRTLHYYEEVGLLPNVCRTSGGHRVYDEGTIKRLEQILELKQTLGYSLKEIKRILQVEGDLDKLRETYQTGNLGHHAQLALLDEYTELLGELADHIDERIDKMREVQKSFHERLDRTKKLRAGIASIEGTTE